MPEITESELFAEFSEGFESLWTILESQARQKFESLTVQARKTVAETSIFLCEMLERVKLNEMETIFANSWLRQFWHVLGREFEGNFILRFYYFDQDYAKEQAKTVHSMISLVVALRAIELYGPKLTRNGTVWEYLERDMPKFRKTLKKILSEDNTEERIDEIFLLLNTIDMLKAIEDSEKLNFELQELTKFAKGIQPLFDNAFRISPGLKVYTADLVNRIGLPIKVSDLPQNLPGKPGAFLALMNLRLENKLSLNQLEDIHHPSALHLWWIARAWIRRLNGESSVGILPFYRRLDVDAIFRLVWGNARELYEIPTDPEETKKVLELTSREIKRQLYEYFHKHPQVTEFSRLRLPAERDKADAGGEISDFNVEFTTGKETIWVAMPIKSGRESKSQTRERMEQKFLYQFIRPIIEFETDKTVVFPIILVKSTLNTNEFLSLLRARLKLPILVLDIESYTRFLKREKLLT